MKSILQAYKRGIGGAVVMHDNGLVWAAADHRALTWMDSIVDGEPVTQRAGYAVEIQALWYNAVSYALSLAEEHKDKAFVEAWKEVPAKTKAAFNEKFWLREEGYLADYVNPGETNTYIRPNMIIACGLNYKMLDESQIVQVLMVVRQHLLTPRGLRSLSPRNPIYKGRIEGDQRQRDIAGKNGTVWIWPLSFYVRTCFDVQGAKFLGEAREILAGFEEDIQAYCIGSVNEVYDADPPYTPRGSISQAWSVGAVLEICRMVSEYGSATQQEPKAAKRAACKRVKSAEKDAAKEAKTASRKTTKK